MCTLKKRAIKGKSKYLSFINSDGKTWQLSLYGCMTEKLIRCKW